MLDFENLEQQRKGDESLHCFMSHGFLGLLTARMVTSREDAPDL